MTMGALPRLAILGFGGRMGQLLVQEALRSPRCRLAALYWREQRADLTLPPNCLVSQDLEAVIAAADIIIEFTLPEASVIFARTAAKLGKPLVSGTTGLSAEQQAEIAKAAQSIPLLQAPNTSLSLAVARRAVTLMARLLKDHAYDLGINDWHHREKRDAPSGTAKALAAASLQGNPALAPHYSAQRLGHIVGEHQVMFVGEGESLMLQHSVTDRAIFARGAIAAALWLQSQPKGLHTMDTMLGL
jgi:4-hydroxy-tetrahydrodipicolinate reductase